MQIHYNNKTDLLSSTPQQVTNKRITEDIVLFPLLVLSPTAY